MSLVVSNLSKKYKEQLAVNDLTFSAKEGEIIGLLGPNGAGKTTTFKMITGFIEPSSGKIEINGENIIENPMLAKKVIGYLPESNPLYGDMYVLEFLNFIQGVHGLGSSKSELKDLCERVGIGKEVNKRISQLSKGYRQRVGIAQAIIHNPDILILDEPTTGLDANQLVEIRSLIKQLGESKLVLFSSHIMQEIEAVCDRVIILDNGIKVADNNLSDLASSEKGETILVEFAEPTASFESYEKIGGVESVKSKNHRTIRFSVSEGGDPRADIFNQAVKNGDVIIHMSKEGETFERTFQKLTGKR